MGRRLARLRVEQRAQTPLLPRRGRGYYTLCRSTVRLTPVCGGSWAGWYGLNGSGSWTGATAFYGVAGRWDFSRYPDRERETECLGSARILAGVLGGCLSLKRKPLGSDCPGGAFQLSLGWGMRGRASSRLTAPSQAKPGYPPLLGPVWVQGQDGSLRGAGREAAEVAGTVFAQRKVRARIPPVGVAELKCIWPPGLREAVRPGIFSSAVVSAPPSPLLLTFVACAFRGG